MATIPQALTALDRQRKDLANNLVAQGVIASESQPLNELVPKVLDISPLPPEDEFVIDPRWNWYDLKAILAEDATPYQYRVAEAIYDSFPTTTITISESLVAVRTSDGAYYTSSTVHTWDVSKDRQLYTVQDNVDGSVTLNESAKSRYIIKYYNASGIALTIPHECYYFVVDRAIFAGGMGNQTEAAAKRALIYFDIINGADTQATAWIYAFTYCTSLVAIPKINTSWITNATQLFYNCRSLKSIPLINTSNMTTMTQMFNGCASLTSIPLIDTANVANMSSMFNGCTSLKDLPRLNTSKVTNISQMFNTCYALKTIPALDVSNASTATSPFTNCTTLITANIKGIRTNTNLSVDPYLLSRNSMMYIIQNRNLDISGSITLSVGATNLAKLSDDDKAIAAANRITLA